MKPVPMAGEGWLLPETHDRHLELQETRWLDERQFMGHEPRLGNMSRMPV